MPLSEKDRHTIETLFKEKGWSARWMCAEMPGRGWPRSSVQNVLRKVRESGTADRRPGSGRPATAMTEDNKKIVLKRAISRVRR